MKQGRVHVRNPGASEKEAADKAKLELTDFCQRVVSVARDKVAYRTGHLRNSVSFRDSRDGNGYELYTHSADPNPTDPSHQSGKGYGAYIELGTRRMAARPFLRPAIVQVLREGKSK